MRDVAEMRGTVRLHNLDETTGEAALMYTATGEKPWHGLGKMVETAQTSKEAIVLARLNWAVAQHRVFAHVPAGEGSQYLPTNRVANVRTDTNAVLGVVGEGYKVLQNEEAFAFMDSVVGEGLAHWETAGSLNGGKRVWMLCKLPQVIRPAEGDEIVPYGLLCNGHDGSLAVNIFPTTVRVVCNNTLNLALNNSEKKSLVIRHSGSMKGKVQAAREQFGLITKKVDGFAEEVQTLASDRWSDKQARGFFETFFPTRIKATDGVSLLSTILEQAENREVAQSLLNKTEGHEIVADILTRTEKANAKILDQILANYEAELPSAKGTAWGAYNALSEYLDHDKAVRGKTNEARADARLNSNWFGASADMKAQAYSAALQVANAR